MEETESALDETQKQLQDSEAALSAALRESHQYETKLSQSHELSQRLQSQIRELEQCLEKKVAEFASERTTFESEKQQIELCCQRAFASKEEELLGQVRESEKLVALADQQAAFNA